MQKKLLRQLLASNLLHNKVEKYFYVFIVLAGWLISACHNDIKMHNSASINVHIDSAQSKDINKTTPFALFLKKYKPLDLPLVIKACKISTEGLIPYSSTDTLYMQQGSLPYCFFKTNGDYIAVISLGLADCSLPILSTFDKNGKKIDEKCICIGGCGTGPGYNCEEYMIIRKNYSIYTSDTISTFEEDSLGNKIKGTDENYVNYKEGQLLSSGKIILSDQQRINLNK